MPTLPRVDVQVPHHGASMKITNCRIVVCCPGRNFVTLKIETDQGVHGIGDATLNGRELAVAAYLTEHIVPTLIGRDPAVGLRVPWRVQSGAATNLRRGL